MKDYWIRQTPAETDTTNNGRSTEFPEEQQRTYYIPKVRAAVRCLVGFYPAETGRCGTGASTSSMSFPPPPCLCPSQSLYIFLKASPVSKHCLCRSLRSVGVNAPICFMVSIVPNLFVFRAIAIDRPGSVPHYGKGRYGPQLMTKFREGRRSFPCSRSSSDYLGLRYLPE